MPLICLCSSGLPIYSTLPAPLIVASSRSRTCTTTLPRPLRLIVARSLATKRVAVESPVYAYARLLFESLGNELVGLHLDRVTREATEWHAGIGIGLHGGIDILKLGRHRLGLASGVSGALVTETGYGSFTFGLVYRQ